MRGTVVGATIKDFKTSQGTVIKGLGECGEYGLEDNTFRAILLFQGLLVLLLLQFQIQNIHACFFCVFIRTFDIKLHFPKTNILV